MITGNISTRQTLSGSISSGKTLTGALNIPVVSPPRYNGGYEFTPSEETQTIPIEDKFAIADIVINSIPDNYGLVTWNGTTLTVS